MAKPNPKRDKNKKRGLWKKLLLKEMFIVIFKTPSEKGSKGLTRDNVFMASVWGKRVKKQMPLSY